jgi:hypothetical protein
VEWKKGDKVTVQAGAVLGGLDLGGLLSGLLSTVMSIVTGLLSTVTRLLGGLVGGLGSSKPPTTGP